MNAVLVGSEEMGTPMWTRPYRGRAFIVLKRPGAVGE